MKKSILSGIIVFINLFTFSQTYVSGIISSDATWVLSGSPYIVTDNVTVSAGVTLTIEPGVIVKFENNKKLIVDSGVLNAVGTEENKIRFTSVFPQENSWDWNGINHLEYGVLNLNHCIIEYALTGIESNRDNEGQITTIRNCIFQRNYMAIQSMNSLTIDSCYFYENNNGVYQFVVISNCVFQDNLEYAVPDGNTEGIERMIKNSYFCGNAIACFCVDSVENCIFRGNDIALIDRVKFVKNNTFTENNLAINAYTISSTDSIIDNDIYYNQIGIQFMSPGAWLTTRVRNNNICHNTIYNVKAYFYGNDSLAYNCWCETDSAVIAASIFDGNDDNDYPFIFFVPFNNCDETVLPDTVEYCPEYPLVTVMENSQNIIKNIYPNPVQSFATIEFSNPENENFELRIVNVFGQEVKKYENISTDKIIIDRENLKEGIYMFRLIHKDNIKASGKFIIND